MTLEAQELAREMVEVAAGRAADAGRPRALPPGHHRPRGVAAGRDRSAGRRSSTSRARARAAAAAARSSTTTSPAACAPAATCSSATAATSRPAASRSATSAWTRWRSACSSTPPSALQGFDLTPTLDIDAEWPLNELRSQEIRWLGKLQPHGQGNPEATLLSRDVSVVEAKTVGEGDRHLRLKLKSGPVVWPAIAFGWEGEVPAEGSHVDVVYSLSSDRYGPSENGGALQLSVLDLAPSAWNKPPPNL